MASRKKLQKQTINVTHRRTIFHLEFMTDCDYKFCKQKSQKTTRNFITRTGNMGSKKLTMHFLQSYLLNCRFHHQLQKCLFKRIFLTFNMWCIQP